MFLLPSVTTNIIHANGLNYKKPEAAGGKGLLDFLGTEVGFSRLHKRLGGARGYFHCLFVCLFVVEMSVILSPPLPASLSLTSCVGGERLTPLGPAVDVTSFTKTNPLNQGHNMAHKSAAARESPHGMVFRRKGSDLKTHPVNSGTKRKLEPTALAIEPVPCKPVTSSTTKPAASPKPSSSSSAKIPALQLQLVSAATLSPTAANGPSTAGRVSPTASTETAAGDAQPSSSAKVKKPSRKEADNHVRSALLFFFSFSSTYLSFSS
jgi:hypothetical protein